MNPARVKKKWCWKGAPDEDVCRTLAAELRIPLAIVRILFQRNITGSDRIKAFLNPSLDQLPPPFSMKGVAEAAAIIDRACHDSQPVVIYGDYDVDGITSTSVLYLFLKHLGLDVSFYLPDRLQEGYGINEQAIRRIHAQIGERSAKNGVLISVDCGISDYDAVETAKKLGLTVIITDHHKPPPRLPPADVVINPLQPGCSFSFKKLAGVGVAFYLIMGIRSHLLSNGFWQDGEVPNLKAYLDLVAMGTISDMVPLVDINRILVRAGLEVIDTGRQNNNLRPGLMQLIDISRIYRRKLTSEDISFRIGPRINAAGRIGDPCQAVELLTTNETDRARELALSLDEINNSRKALGQSLYEQALAMAEKEVAKGRKSLVLWGEDWHPGVIGIAASRLVEQYGRPTIILSLAQDQAKGSGRAIPGLNLYEALGDCGDVIIQYGGHEGAAGMTVMNEKLIDFSNIFEEVVARKFVAEDLTPELWIDWQAETEELFDESFLAYYVLLAPFRIGNPEPVISTQKIRLQDPRVVGNDHLKFFLLTGNRMQRQGIGFGLGAMRQDIIGKEVDIAYNVRLNEFRGQEKWEFNLVDISNLSS